MRHSLFCLASLPTNLDTDVERALQFADPAFLEEKKK